jgi:hypothetical protein
MDLVAQQEIRDVLIRYTRGIDRMDADLVRSAYWPGAHDDHGAFRGSVEELIDWLTVLEHFDVTMHCRVSGASPTASASSTGAATIQSPPSGSCPRRHARAAAIAATLRMADVRP